MFLTLERLESSGSWQACWGVGGWGNLLAFLSLSFVTAKWGCIKGWGVKILKPFFEQALALLPEAAKLLPESRLLGCTQPLWL